MDSTEKFLIERVQYIAPDDTEYTFFNGRRTLISWRGMGTPDLDYITDRGPFQHGVSVRDYRFQPRTLRFEIYESGRERRDWYRYQANLIDAIRQNRSANSITPGKIRVMLDDGAHREIDAYMGRGPAGAWDGLGSAYASDMREVPEFLCPDPFWRDVQISDEDFAISLVNSCLDHCLPFCLGANIINTTADIVYTGTWYGDQITMLLVGPMASPRITNQITNKSIALNYAISSGETVTIDIGPNAATVTNNFGDNLIGTITSISDLVDFTLVPESDLSSDGTNTIEVIASGGIAGTTGISILYYTRYITLYGSGD